MTETKLTPIEGINELKGLKLYNSILIIYK